ncbi:MAG: glycosyltransferase family 4 protein [Pseudomonadota bacterium]
MKLLYAFPEPLPLPRARGLQVVQTVRALAEQQVEVDLYHAPGAGDPFGACDLSAPQGVNLLPLSRSLPWPLERVHSNRIFVARLARRLVADPPDAIMVRHLKLARALLGRFAQVPLLYEAHEVFADTVPERRRATTARLEGYVVEHAHAVVANSQATASRLGECYRPARSVHVIPNGVDVRSAIAEKDWAHCGERIVYAGSFFDWKGVDDLVVAARELPGLRISLLGGDENSIRWLRMQAAAGGAELEFSGRVSPRHVAQALDEACIAVLPNRADADSVFTSPIKLFEYMAAGCAIVASDLPAVREILAEDEAVWFRPGDAQALAVALRSLAADAGLARALSARVRIKARQYTWRARGERLCLLLRSMAPRA